MFCNTSLRPFVGCTSYLVKRCISYAANIKTIIRDLELKVKVTTKVNVTKMQILRMFCSTLLRPFVGFISYLVKRCISYPANIKTTRWAGFNASQSVRGTISAQLPMREDIHIRALIVPFTEWRALTLAHLVYILIPYTPLYVCMSVRELLRDRSSD